MSKRVVVFNHKGGVSKTTSAYNIGWMAAKSRNVLLVDADPQCNLTNLILGDGFEPFYTNDNTRLNNLKDGVAPAFLGKPTPIQAIDCPAPQRAPTLFLLPGHANLSEYDAALTFAQTSNNAIATLQNLPGAFAELLKKTEEKYNIDLTIIDLNPGLSAINQNFFLISDGFIVPTNPDPFSIMALDTLEYMLPRWATWKRTSLSLFSSSAYPLPPGTPKFIGALIQRFNIRKGKAAKPYRENIAEIAERIESITWSAWHPAGMSLEHVDYEETGHNLCLGEIPDFQGLLPKAYDAGVPVYDLTDQEIGETGPILAGFKQKRDAFRDQFSHITKIVLDRMDRATGSV